MVRLRFAAYRRNEIPGTMETTVRIPTPGVDPYQLESGHEGPDSGYEGIGLFNLKRARLDRIVEFHAEFSFRCLPRLLEQGVKADFAFVDGMHTFDYAFVDFFFLDKMLKPGGVVIFDDLYYPSIHKVCRYIVRNLLQSARRLSGKLELRPH
jgi:Methyltransferase domain